MKEKVLKRWLEIKGIAEREDGQEVVKILGVLAMGALLMGAMLMAINAFAPSFAQIVVDFIGETLKVITG